MRAAVVAALGILAAAPLVPGRAEAEPFRCPRMGGSFVFGQEANVNSLDQMTSNTISTRNIAMNVYEALMTRDENNNPILDLADSMQSRRLDHMTFTFKLRPGVQIPQRQADDLGRRGRELGPLQQGRPGSADLSAP